MIRKRLNDVSKALKKSFNEISVELGYSKGYLYQMVNGKRELKDRVIIAICEKYGVSETWLRTGDGEMFVSSEPEITDEERLRQYISKLLLNLPEPARQSTLEFMRKLIDDCESKED